MNRALNCIFFGSSITSSNALEECKNIISLRQLTEYEALTYYFSYIKDLKRALHKQLNLTTAS